MDKDWEQIVSGSSRGLESLYSKLYRELTAYGLFCGYSRDEVKDGIQQLFLQIWEKRERLQHVQSVKPYLYTWLRRILKEKIQASENMADLKDFLYDNEAPHETVLIRTETAVELQEQLRSALASLTPKQRQAIEMRFFEKLSYEEIATRTSNQTRTAYNLVYESIKILKNYFKK